MSDSQHQRLHWNTVSSHWEDLGPPLRPGPTDLETMLRAAKRFRVAQSGRRFRVILWGVTPELALMDWPGDTDLLAIDRSEEMIRCVWPGDVPGRRTAVPGEWADTARITGGGCNLLMGDGSLANAVYPGEFRDLLQVARQSLHAGGGCIMRLHAGPEVRESLEQVLEDLFNLKIGNFHIFKFRLAMSFQESAEAGIGLGEIWERWRALNLDEADLARMTGWSLRVIRTIDLYRGKQTRYWFPTLSQQIELFREVFAVREVYLPTYEMGERRPIVVLGCGGG